MNSEYLELCKKEINSLLKKKLIIPSYSDMFKKIYIQNDLVILKFKIILFWTNIDINDSEFLNTYFLLQMENHIPNTVVYGDMSLHNYQQRKYIPREGLIIDNIQKQCILDNIWILYYNNDNLKAKHNICNALTNYFLDSEPASNRYSHYAVCRTR